MIYHNDTHIIILAFIMSYIRVIFYHSSTNFSTGQRCDITNSGFSGQPADLKHCPQYLLHQPLVCDFNHNVQTDTYRAGQGSLMDPSLCNQPTQIDAFVGRGPNLSMPRSPTKCRNIPCPLCIYQVVAIVSTANFTQLLLTSWL